MTMDVYFAIVPISVNLIWHYQLRARYTAPLECPGCRWCCAGGHIAWVSSGHSSGQI